MGHDSQDLPGLATKSYLFDEMSFTVLFCFCFSPE